LSIVATVEGRKRPVTWTLRAVIPSGRRAIPET
jgi:hypothetical protein